MAEEAFAPWRLSIVKDSRQQAGKHKTKDADFMGMGVQQVSGKLPYGDYALMPSASVDTKKDLYELYSCLLDKRFDREMAGARASGCQLYVLTETDEVASLDDLVSWVEPQRHFDMRVRKSGSSRARRIRGAFLVHLMREKSSEFGTVFIFCAPNDAARTIIEILKGGDDGQGA